MFKRLRFLESILLIVFSCATGYSQTSDSFPDLIEKVKPSVVSISTYDKDGKGMASGTGFCVGLNLIITNYHVIEGAARIEIQSSTNRAYRVIKIESSDRGGDLALLQTEQLEAEIQPLRISRTAPRVGEKVLVLGNPLGLSGSVSDGIVAAFRTAPIGKLIQITAPISHGSSGSPVVNMNGEVIGVATLNLDGGQNLNFAVSAGNIIAHWASFLSIVDSRPNTNEMATGRWRLLNKGVAFDKSTFSKIGSNVSAWIRYDGSDALSTKVFTEINCAREQIRQSRSISYSALGAVLRDNALDTKWTKIVPDSMGEEMYKVFCKGSPDHQAMLDWARFNDMYGRAYTFTLAKDYEPAIAIYTKVILELPDYAANAHNAIADIKLAQGKIREAKIAALQSVQLDPSSSVFFSTLGDIYKEEKNYPEAVKTYIKSFQLDQEKNFTSEASLIEIYEDTKNYIGLTNLYLSLISAGEIYHYEDLAKAYANRGQPTLARITRQKGIGILEKSISASSSNWKLYVTLADLYESLNNRAKLEQTLVAASDANPNDYFFTTRLAQSYNRSNQWTKAVQVILAVFPRSKLKWEKIPLLKLLKISYLGLHQLEEAEGVDQQLLDLQ